MKTATSKVFEVLAIILPTYKTLNPEIYHRIF